MIWSILGILAGVVLVVWTYSIVMSPELQYHSFWYKTKAKLIFWAGDIRRINAFPWVTWATKDHGLSYREMREASDVCRAGDVGLHRDSGFLSNLAIPGGFKHAWVCVENQNIVEAISEGVVLRGNLAPLLTDYAVILRPMRWTKRDADEAVRRAMSVVGSDYDANFKFDFEEADASLNPEEQERTFTRNLGSGKFHPAFSCTEVAGYAWYHCRKKLRIFRSKHAGRDAIIADDYLRMNFGIVWLSESVTPEWAESVGMLEEAVQKIRDYWSGKRSFNRHGNPLPQRK